MNKNKTKYTTKFTHTYLTVQKEMETSCFGISLNFFICSNITFHPIAEVFGNLKSKASQTISVSDGAVCLANHLEDFRVNFSGYATSTIRNLHFYLASSRMRKLQQRILAERGLSCLWTQTRRISSYNLPRHGIIYSAVWLCCNTLQSFNVNTFQIP